MTGTALVPDELQDAPAPTPPRGVTPLAALAAVLAVGSTAVSVWAGLRLRDYNDGGPISTTVAVVLVLGSLYAWWPALRAFAAARTRATLLAERQIVPARRIAAAGRENAQISMGYAAAAVIVAGVLLIALTGGAGIAHTFFTSSAWRQSFPESIRAFWTNIWVAVVSEVLVLILGLLVAIVRMLPGRGGAPLRFIALVYCDVFRAVPAIVVIALVVFGVPLAFPSTARWNPVWFGILALTLTYTAYVSEVYRAGLASIHPSQGAAARSLGLSYTQTLRKVLVPQAVRRVIPPLLNDFISLQKDTALLSTAGVLEVLLTSSLWQNKLFNLSPVTLAAVFFVIITIPQARFVDYLIDRDASKRGGQ